MGIALNATYDSDGPVISEHAGALACEGIVSKRAGSLYRAGRTDEWLKMKTHLHQPSVVMRNRLGEALTSRLAAAPYGALRRRHEGRFHSLAAPWNCSLAPRRDWVGRALLGAVHQHLRA